MVNESGEQEDCWNENLSMHNSHNTAAIIKILNLIKCSCFSMVRNFPGCDTGVTDTAAAFLIFQYSTVQSSRLQ